MKRFKNILLVVGVVLVILVGGYSITKIQDTASSFFNKQETLNINELHPNEESYEKEINFKNKEDKMDYKISDFSKKDNTSKYKKIEFENKDDNKVLMEKKDISIISITFLIAVISLIVIGSYLFRKYL